MRDFLAQRREYLEVGIVTRSMALFLYQVPVSF